MVWVPEDEVVAERLGSLSHSIFIRQFNRIRLNHWRCGRLIRTLPSVSIRMNLYWNVVDGGKLTVTVHTGYVAADKAICPRLLAKTGKARA